jgi:hypothetical protein
MAGPAVTELTIAGDPDAWRAAGFEVGPDGLACVGSVRLRLGGSGEGISEWALDHAASADLDGLPTELAPAGVTAPGRHPNGVVGIDHVVVMTPDLERTLAALGRGGFELRRTRDAGEAQQAFFRVGETVLEVVGPVPPDGPARFWGLVFVVEDIDRAAALLGPALGRVKEAVQPGQRIATVRGEARLGVPVALISPRPPRE